VKKMGYKLFFVESVCDDPSIVEQNIMVIMRMSNVTCASIVGDLGVLIITTLMSFVG